MSKKSNPVLIYSEAIKNVGTLYNVTLFYDNGEIATLRNVTRNQIKTSGNVLEWSSRHMTSSTITKRQAAMFAKKLPSGKDYRRAVDIASRIDKPYHVTEAYLAVARYYGYVESNGFGWRQVPDDMRGVMDHVCDEAAAKKPAKKTYHVCAFEPREFGDILHDCKCLAYSEEEARRRYEEIGWNAEVVSQIVSR